MMEVCFLSFFVFYLFINSVECKHVHGFPVGAPVSSNSPAMQVRSTG